MKRKTLLCLAIVLSMALSLMPAIVLASPAALDVEFQETESSEYVIVDCVPDVEDILVDLVISDVTEMIGWTTNVSWNPDVLYMEKYTLGPFNCEGTSLTGYIDNDKGMVECMVAGTMTPDVYKTGSGVVVTLDFTCIATGVSFIDLTLSGWRDLDKVFYALDDSSGRFECTAYVGPPRASEACFTPETCAQFALDKEFLNVTVDFDACCSEGSYDSMPDPGTENPIISYSWDFDGDSCPDYVSGGAAQIGKVFITHLLVENIQDYFHKPMPGDYDFRFIGWSCKVEWDSALMNCTGFDDEPSEWLAKCGLDGSIGYIDNVAGTIGILAYGVLEKVPMEEIVSSSGAIVRLSFLVPSGATVGSNDINITESTIATSYKKAGGTYIDAKPYTPEFEVAFGLPDCTASWMYDETYPGAAIDAPVTLCVYAPDFNATETHPDFTAGDFDRDCVTETIHILPPVMGPEIDVYVCNHEEPWKGTGKGCDKITGEEYGPEGDPPVWSAMADAFGPQEEVCVCALVTYNDEPVENKLVAFEIRDPEGGFVAWRSAATNSEGIACVDFRIPWMGVNASEVFGAWLITATVDIAEEVVMDKCRFRFGWLVSIVDTELVPMSLKKEQVLEVEVTLANIAFTPKDIVLAVVLYDECGVPINHFASGITVDPVGMVAPTISLKIPTWAFVGTGTAYVNVFDTWPHLGGTPMCPEDSETFVILNT